MSVQFVDRADAGRALATRLGRYRGPNTLCLGLPRGGVVVAAAVAEALNCGLDVIVTRKIPAPGNPEYAIGAVSEGGGIVLNDDEVAALGIGPDYITRQIQNEEQEIQRRIQLYRNGAPLPALANRPVLVVDDGVATGFTMLAALRAVRHLGASPVVMATPVIPPRVLSVLSYECDDAVVIAAPEPFYAVGMFYQDFEQVSDEEVINLLKQAHSRQQLKRKTA
ncbi:MAG TPA: phosphoribosyltransferase family protein [Chloroflexota bacterium]|nr:phosphoribosyltransferase family protein [Chloroflexota bacterium]